MEALVSKTTLSPLCKILHISFMSAVSGNHVHALLHPTRISALDGSVSSGQWERKAAIGTHVIANHTRRIDLCNTFQCAEAKIL